jgi:hypothetical protein
MKRRNLTIAVFALFIFLLIFIERGPWSSAAVAKYNHGYGTFDMKTYTPDTVYQVLDQMEAVGFDIYKKYLIGDNLFTVIFCILQLLLQSYAFLWSKSKLLHRTLYLIPMARMLLDLTENIALHHILQKYPQRLDSLINFSSIVTKTKLNLVGLWFPILMIGFIILVAKKVYQVIKYPRD